MEFELVNQTLSSFQAMSLWEYIAVGFALIYLRMAMLQNQWCWPAALISTLIYTILFWNGLLLMESFLNLYYMAMAVFGWWTWRQGQENISLPISKLKRNTHLQIILVCSIVSVSVGYIMDNYTQADYAYLDSFTTIFSLMTTYLVVRKELYNWIYWVVIDAASIYLYLMKGYYPTAALFVLYTVIAAVAYFRWQNDFQAQFNQSQELDQDYSELNPHQPS